MSIEDRLKNLEDLVNNLIKNVNQHNSYVDADIMGCRESISNVNSSVYPLWDGSGHEYYQGEKVTYEQKYYRCVQNHKSQIDWTPEAAPSLWSEISDPTEEFPEWRQPTGAHDAYSKGDKVSHNSKHWISDMDANVYEPGVYGWSEV